MLKLTGTCKQGKSCNHWLPFSEISQQAQPCLDSSLRRGSGSPHEPSTCVKPKSRQGRVSFNLVQTADFTFLSNRPSSPTRKTFFESIFSNSFINRDLWEVYKVWGAFLLSLSLSKKSNSLPRAENVCVTTHGHGLQPCFVRTV